MALWRLAVHLRLPETLVPLAVPTVIRGQIHLDSRRIKHKLGPHIDDPPLRAQVVEDDLRTHLTSLARLSVVMHEIAKRSTDGAHLRKRWREGGRGGGGRAAGGGGLVATRTRTRVVVVCMRSRVVVVCMRSRVMVVCISRGAWEMGWVGG